MRDVEGCTQFVGHGMADAQKGVGESHTGHGGGVVHFLAGAQVLITVIIGALEVLVEHTQGFKRQAVGVIGGSHRYDSFQRVDDSVVARGSGQRFGHTDGQIRIDDGHIRGQRIIGDGVFEPGAIIGDDGKGSNLRTGTRSGGDGNKGGLLVANGEGIDPLADVHKAQGQAFKFYIRVFV
ncbi:hypothetical protein SDC9_175814 [bioreactor metagenome]|uniref:Uncharacterized protein n=1 Tax=bioreactor metagenome TaxID=1076179 RepID=A0A645GXJ1_9ZZZZ